MNSLLKIKQKARKLAKTKNLKLKDALALIAKENKFEDWKSYKNSLDTFWYQKTSPFLNHWFVRHSEAKEFRNKNGGFLLTFKGQYFVASSEYIEYIGIDPNDTIWESIDYDVSSSNALEKFHTYYKKSQEN